MGQKNNGNFFLKFIGNKNTVTILGIVTCIIVLVGGYTFRVQNAVDPTIVPYAKQTIESRTLIKETMIGKVKIDGSYLKSATNVVKNASEVLNMYATYKSNIPKGSLFYKEMLKTEEQMPDSAWSNIADGYTIFSLPVNSDDTYGNQVHAGQYIDLYARAKNSSAGGKIIFAQLIESIRVLSVKDSAGNNILEGENGTPSELLFAVPEDLFLLLSRATNIQADVEIIPVIRNQKYTADQNETKVTYEQLVDFINSYVTRYGEGE